MKHLFIFNPRSLSKKLKQSLCERIRTACKGLEYEIYFSVSERDAEDKARAEAAKGEELCVYAGGGDGSVHQMAQAIYGHDNACLSVIPIGTGNDFVRNFGGKERFLSLDQIQNGVERRIDLIKANDYICANMLNIGFDAAVCHRVDKLRGLPFMKHAAAYTIALVFELVRFPKETLKILINGKEKLQKFLLTFIANGKYCGGGYKAASEADPADGLLDVMTIKPISRLRFFCLVGSYKKGTLLGKEKYAHLYSFEKVQEITLKKDSPFWACLDGEMYQFKELTVSVLPKALRLRIPN